jgi:hypothetical protein
MANHVTNFITFKNVPIERLNQILETIKNDEEGIGTIDFNKIIPMPDNVFKGNIGPANREEYGEDNWLDWSVANWNTKWNAFGFMPYIPESSLDTSQNDKPRATKTRIHDLMVNFAQTGDELSYEEAKEIFHNEVAFGEVESSNSADTIAFDTAWNAPHTVIRKLSKDYPEIRIQHQWADESIGFVVGVREYINGETVYKNIPRDGSKEAFELAAEIKEEDLADLGYRLSGDGRTYEYFDETDGQDKTEKLIKVVLVKPMQKPQIIEIGSDLESMQKIVRGSIQEIMPFPDEEVAIVCNEEGKIEGLDLNRGIRDSNGDIYDIIEGDFFICSVNGENFTSLTDEQAKRYCEKYKYPEKFYMSVDGIKAVPIIKNKERDYER